MRRVSDETLNAICEYAQRCEDRGEATTFQWIALDCRDDRATIAELRGKLARAREALECFGQFASNVDDEGWTSKIHRESISTWFGPSDFRAAARLHADLSADATAGGENRDA